MPKEPFRKWAKNRVMRRWYTFINRADAVGALRLMNYGYHSDTEAADLHAMDEPERYPIQLYHHLASFTEIRGKDLLEVGCGRGGGLSYVARRMEPRSARGVDLNSHAIEFCRSEYPRISFDVMDAEHLEFPDESFDVVLNVESSHRYPQFARFANEVYRVLRPGGSFLFTDFRHSHEMDMALSDIRRAGFRENRLENINGEVLEALRRDGDRRDHLIRSHLPVFVRFVAREFAGTPGTALFKSFERGTRRYVCCEFAR